MTGYLIVLVVGFAATGLYNLGKKARVQEKTDEDFFRKQLHLAKAQCHEIAWQFSGFLADQRMKYLRKDKHGNLIYDDWYKLGIEPFFHSKVSPRLIDAQRDSLINFGNYVEIIDHVAKSGYPKKKKNALQCLVSKGWPLS
ncbi:MAG TPA: hypothetical protein ENH02_07035 [Bacteroidetes bacterium]|nr:hypothetical protein [Bacteroidota bacterium]